MGKTYERGHIAKEKTDLVSDAVGHQLVRLGPHGRSAEGACWGHRSSIAFGFYVFVGETLLGGVPWEKSGVFFQSF